MEALSALAIVAQKAIPPVGQEAIAKALLEAELERTRLDYERSRMVAEDNRIKCYKHVHKSVEVFLQNRVMDIEARLEDAED